MICLKKVWLVPERKALAKDYISYGLNRDKVLEMYGISKHQYYHHPRLDKAGKKPSETTLKLDLNNEIKQVSNLEVVDRWLALKVARRPIMAIER